METCQLSICLLAVTDGWAKRYLKGMGHGG
jgi:hypothetical protein